MLTWQELCKDFLQQLDKELSGFPLSFVQLKTIHHVLHLLIYLSQTQRIHSVKSTAVDNNSNIPLYLQLKIVTKNICLKELVSQSFSYFRKTHDLKGVSWSLK